MLISFVSTTGDSESNSLGRESNPVPFAILLLWKYENIKVITGRTA